MGMNVMAHIWQSENNSRVVSLLPLSQSGGPAYTLRQQVPLPTEQSLRVSDLTLKPTNSKTPAKI